MELITLYHTVSTTTRKQIDFILAECHTRRSMMECNWLHTVPYTPLSVPHNKSEATVRAANCSGWSRETEKMLLFTLCLLGAQDDWTLLNVTELFSGIIASRLGVRQRGETIVFVCARCYHCYCVWHSPVTQHATSSAPSLSWRRSSGGVRRGAREWGGTELHTWWTGYLPLCLGHLVTEEQESRRHLK